MPPQNKVSKDDIVKTAVDIIRASGLGAFNARAVAAKLGISTQPIFSHFDSMEALRASAINYAEMIYQRFLKTEISSGKYPPYKASGMGYIRFAKEEKELFRLLFMRNRSQEKSEQQSNELEPLIRIIMSNTGLNHQDAYIFHLEMWAYVHGIAAMIATSFLEWDWEMIDRMLTDAYQGLNLRYQSKE